MKDRVVRAVFAAALVAVGCGSAWAEIPASAYVQSGLVGHWDGIENAGAGQHDNAATAWVDLVGGIGDAARKSDKVVWQANCWTNDVDGKPFEVDSDFANVLATKCFTLEVRVRPTRTSDRETIIGNYSEGQNFNLEHNGASPTGCFRFYCNNAPNWGTPATVAADEAVTAAFVAPADDYPLAYKNGTLAGTHNAKITASMTGNHGTIFGGEYNRANMAFRGAFYAVRIYNRTLTPEEVAYNALVDKIRFENLEGYRWNAETGKIECRVRVAAGGAHGTVTLDGEELATDYEGWFEVGTAYTIVATPAEGWRFVRWHGLDDPVLAAEPTIQLAVDRPLSLTAVFDRADALTASSYVQSGLIAQWDGIENAGRGTHDDGTNVWVDLVGDIDFPLAGCEISADTISIPSGVSPTIERSIFDSPSYTQPVTVEFNWATPSLPTASSYSDYFLFASDESYFYRQNDTQAIFPVLAKGSPNKHWSKFAYSVAEQREFATASFVNGATASTDCGFYYNAARRERLGDATTSTLTAIRRRTSLCLSATARSYDVKYRAIRCYNRVLTPFEVRCNVAVDQIRFLGAEKAESEGWRFNAEEGRIEACVSAKADGDGSVKIDDGDAGANASAWVPLSAEGTVTFTATPAEGQVFVAWSGDVLLTAEQRASTSLSLAADRARKLTAHFVAAESDRWTYSQTAGQISCGTTILNVTATAGVEGGLTVSGVSAFDGGLIDLRLPIVGAEDGGWYVVTSVGAVLKSNLTVTELRLPDTVTEIAANAFSGAANLTKVVLPSGLTKIGDNAFLNCYELKDVTPFLPNSVTNVGASVFESCTNLSGKICLHGAIRLGANIVKTTKIGEVDLDGAPLYSFGAGNYSSVTNFHPLLPPTVGGSCPPSWSGANLGGHQKICLCSPNFTYLSGDNIRYNTWSDIDMTGSSIAKTGSWCFYGCGSLTNVIFSEAFTTFPNANVALGNCGALRWVRFRGDPPQALTTNPFQGHSGMCYYFPKWSEEWETYIAEGMKPDGETTVDCTVSEMTSDECKNFLSAHPGEPIPTQRISIGGAGTRAISTTKGFLWWYTKAPPVYKTVALFDLLRYQEQAGIAPAGDEMAPKLFDGTTYTYCKETAHLALRWLVGVDGSAEIALPAAATVARAMRTEGYRVHQMPIGDYANARAPTAWTLYGKTSDEGEWTVIDQVAMTAESANRWAYFDDPTGYPVTGKTQATPPRAQCSLTYELPQEKWDRYVAFKFVPTGSYNQDNDVEDETPYGLMELEILGELTTSEPHIGGLSVTRRGWNDMDFAFDLDSIGDRGADGLEPQSAVAWVEVATDDTFEAVVSATAPVSVTAGKGLSATVTGLAGRTTYAARVIVSNDLELTAVQTLAGGASTLEAPFELGAVTTSVGEDGRLEVTVEVKALYSSEIDLDLVYRETMNAEPASLGQKKATAAGFVVFATDVEPGKSSFVDLTAASDGISQMVTRTPFGFWLADSADAPTRISNSVTRTTFTVTKDTAGLKLSKLVDIGDTATIDLTTLVAAPDGSALAIVSPGTALNSNTDVAELLLPDTVTAIPNTACQNCSRLRKLRLPAALASIGDSAFSGCAQLAEVENFFPPTCVKLGSSSFYTCAKIPNFTLADGLESIPGNCFYGCSKITDLHIPDSVTNISGGAFAGVSSLTNLTPRFLPPQIRTSSLSAFHDGNTKCNAPLVLDNPEMKSIPGDGFRYNNFTSIDMLGSSINSIGTLAFYSVPLQWIRFPTNVVTFAAHDTYTFTSTVLREVIFPGEPPVFTKNIFGSSYYIIRIPNENASWEALLKDHAEKGWLTDMTDAERKTFRQRYPGVRPVPKQWLNLHGLTGKRYLMYLKGPGLLLFVK